MERPQMVSRCRDLQLARLEEFLVAAIEQPGDLAVQQYTGPRKYLRRSIRGRGNLGRATELPHLKGVRRAFCTILRRCHIKSLTAKDGENIIERAYRGLFRHKCHHLDSKLTVAHSQVRFKPTPTNRNHA